MQRHAPCARTVATFFLTLLTASLLHAGAARAQVNIPSNADYACDFENSYCDFFEQSKLAVTGGRRSSLAVTAVHASRYSRASSRPGISATSGDCPEITL